MKVLIACEYSATVRNAFEAMGHYARSCDLLPTEVQQPVRFRHEFGCMEHEQFDPACEACEHDEPWCHRCGMYAYECPCLGPTEDEAEYVDCEHGARHLTGDLFSIDRRELESYDLLIAHPPCTHLAVSGARWLTRHWVKKGRGGYWHDPTDKLRLQAEAIAFVKRIWAMPIPLKCIENPISRLSTLWQKPTQIVHPWQFGHGETKATCLWLTTRPTYMFIRASKKSLGGQWACADYRQFPELIDDAVLRDNAAWSKWCEENQVRVKAMLPAEVLK